MTMSATPIRPIYEMPDHSRYGPARRLWVMLEQLYADFGGVRPMEIAVKAFQDHHGLEKPTWDAHLAWLMDSGLSESAAQRMVLQQFLVAVDFSR